MSKIPLRPPLSEEVGGKLQAAVAQGRWKVGERIPAEPELMAEMGVSRGTVREAVKALASTGIFEVRRGDGTYVRATSEISGTAQRVFRDHSDQDVLQVRFALDTQSARLAAKAADAKVIEKLRALLSQRSEAWEARDYPAWAQADWKFHLEVARASGVPLMSDIYESFGDVFHGTKMVQRLSDGFDGCLHEGHESLVDAIQAGDPEAAARTVIKNLDYCMSWMP